MQLTPTERDRLLIFQVAQLARARQARGLALNVPEATALIADTVCEAARDGRRHADAISAGRAVLGPEDVLPGVADILADVKVEALFEDGTRLVVVPDPIGGGALGAFAPGAMMVAADPDPSRDSRLGVATIEVHNTASVPIAVTSHFHFLEVNPRLAFDRAAAYGRHLDVAAGSSVAFPPGGTVQVRLVPIAGSRVVIGMAGLVDGPLDAPGARQRALDLLRATGFLDTGADASAPTPAADDAVGRLVEHLHAHPEVQR
ncbi:MAG: urease subunit gamma [Candidatus Nanopelagicales bacterium]